MAKKKETTEKTEIQKTIEKLAQQEIDNLANLGFQYVEGEDEHGNTVRNCVNI